MLADRIAMLKQLGFMDKLKSLTKQPIATVSSEQGVIASNLVLVTMGD